MGSDASAFGRAPAATGGFPSVVVLEPEHAGELPAPADAEVMGQSGTAFHPRVLLARRGQPVAFRNDEGLEHNVHVVDRERRSSELNLSTPPYQSYTHTFEREGVYAVSCDIHPAMAAFILIVSTPYAAVADREGLFSLDGVPPGSYRLTVWNLDPSRSGQRVVEIGRRPTELDLTRIDRPAPSR